MDPPADLRPKHVVDEPVLGDPSQTLEGWGGDRGVEVVPVTGDLGTRARNPRLDSSFQLIGGYRHPLKRSEMLSLY